MFPCKHINWKLIIFNLLTIQFASTAILQQDHSSPSNPFVNLVKETIKHCLSQSNIALCLKIKVVSSLDKVISDNSTWYVNEYVSVEKDQDWCTRSTTADVLKSSAGLVEKLKDLIESRSIKLKPGPLIQVEEGRKKKYKGDKGGFAMMGGMAIMGLMAQMIIGKLVFLAGGAFILAKIALLYSILSSIKKTGGGSGGGEQHVIYTDSGSNSGGHGSGWHRSIPRYNPYNTYNAHHAGEDFHETSEK